MKNITREHKSSYNSSMSKKKRDVQICILDKEYTTMSLLKLAVTFLGEDGGMAVSG
jgi:hypothetical protein